MFDPQVSYIRILIGDNDRTAPFYTDEQIHAAATIGPERPPFPAELRIAGTVGKVRFPLPLSEVTPAELSLLTLTDEQLAALTDEQLASLVD